jgi:hypothetical protein
VAPRPMAGNVPMATMPPFIANQGSKKKRKVRGKDTKRRAPRRCMVYVQLGEKDDSVKCPAREYG